jgi:hypothetical protein
MTPMQIVRRIGRLIGAAIIASLLLPTLTYADLAVGPGSVVSLGSGGMDMGCSDIYVSNTGILQLDSAQVTGVRNVTIESGGQLDFGSGSLTVSGAFVNHGTVKNNVQNSILTAYIPSCAPQGPSIVGVELFHVPTLSFWGVIALMLLLAGFAARESMRRSHVSNEQE